MFGLSALKVRTNPDFQGQFAVPAKNYPLWKFLLFSRPPDVYNHISCEAFKNINRRCYYETEINSCEQINHSDVIGYGLTGRLP